MRETATLRLDSGREVRVDVETLSNDEILVKRIDAEAARLAFLAVIDRHLASATPHTAGTTDRLREADISSQW